MIRRLPFLLTAILTASALMLWSSPGFAAGDVVVTQAGDNGQVEISQSADGGSVVVEQAALSAHARAVIEQSGADGTILLFQGGVGAGPVPNGGPVAGTEGNYADLTQTGDGKITIYQGVETPIGNGEPAVSIAGTFANSIVFVQGDGNNTATLTQIGPDNVIIGSQAGLNNAMTVLQLTDQATNGNILQIDQNGEGNRIDFEQTDTGPGAVTLGQIGDFNTILLKVGGDSTLTFIQEGDFAFLDLDLSSTGHLAVINQTGEDNTFMLSQPGDGNFATIDQHTDDPNTATIDQLGNDNETILGQNGNAVAEILQTGDGNLAVVTQN